MKPLHLAATLAAAVSLSACGQKTETNAATAETQAATNAGSDMGNMAMPADATMAKSVGTVTAIDKAAGKITLDHQAIPDVSWPAMTMTFGAKPEILNGIAVGDKVAFDVTIAGNAGLVTAVTKQ